MPPAIASAAAGDAPASVSDVWIVDDDSDIRFSLALLLGNDAVNVRVFAHAQAFYDALNTGQPHCLILDYDLPDTDGLAVQTHLAANGVHVPIIFLSATTDIQVAVTAMRRGALDFIEKPDCDGQLLAAVTTALSAGRARQARCRAVSDFREALLTLSPREHDVLDAISRGERNKHVARRFDISPRTVETHRENAMRKLRVRNTAQLIRVYILASLDRAERLDVQAR